MTPNPETAAPTNLSGYTPDPRPKWKQALARLWPYRHHDAGDLPPWAKDCIYVDTTVSLSFVDRLRVLASGRLRVRSATFAEHAPGKMVSTSLAHPLPPVMLERGIGFRIWGQRESNVMAASVLFGAALFCVTREGGLPAVLLAVWAIILLVVSLTRPERLEHRRGLPPRPAPEPPPRPGKLEAPEPWPEPPKREYPQVPPAPLPPRTRIVGVEKFPYHEKAALAAIPVTEIRDGDVLVVTMPGGVNEAQAEANRAKIRERMLPTKVDALLMMKPGHCEWAISHILRPALCIGVDRASPGATDETKTAIVNDAGRVVQKA